MAATLIPAEGGSPIPLDKPIMLIGRNQDCDISLQTSSKISRRHCCIIQCGDRYLVRDLGSMNGVRVNSQRVVEAELKPGDEVAVADVGFTFRADDAKGKRRDQRPVDAAGETPDRDETPGAAEETPEARSDGSDGDLPPAILNSADDPDVAILKKDDSESEAGFVRV